MNFENIKKILIETFQEKLTQKNKRFIFGNNEKADLNITPKNVNSNKIILHVFC